MRSRSASSLSSGLRLAATRRRRLEARSRWQRRLERRRRPTAPRPTLAEHAARACHRPGRRSCCGSSPRCLSVSRQLVALLVDHACAGRWRRRRTRAAACGCRSCATSTRFCASGDRAIDDRVLDRLALGHLQPLHDAGEALAAEDAQQRVLERQVEARRSGSPWRPERPRSWLSMRRDSCRSVPMICRPPAAMTCSWRTCHSRAQLADLQILSVCVSAVVLAQR